MVPQVASNRREHSQESYSHSAHQVNFVQFRGLEISSPCSKEPCTERDECSQHHPTVALQNPFLILYSCLRLGFQSGFHTKILYAFLFLFMRAKRPTKTTLL
jgi:hypothetical protein